MVLKKIYYFLVSILGSVLFLNQVYAQDIPDRPVPPRLVNDFAGMLSGSDVNRLEQKLVAFNDSTSTQIAIVTVTSLSGYDKADYAQQLAEKWGIGRKGLNNGVLVLVKPKTVDSKGEVFIAQGYGLEGAIPDITAAEIIDNEILPAFRNGDYYVGLDNATTILMSLARGEFSAHEYGQTAKKSSGKGSPIVFIIIVIILILLFSKKGGSRNRRISTGGLPFWLLMGMLGSGGRSHRGSWGGFSGGGGGGFGGFGGGSFGGGGAGGSW